MDIKMIVCKECGVAEAWRGSQHVYCSTCRTTGIKRSRVKTKKKKGWSGINYPIEGKCRSCETSFIKRKGDHVYCPKCTKENRKKASSMCNKQNVELLADQYVIDKLRTTDIYYMDIPKKMFPHELIVLKRVNASIDRHTRGKRYGTK